MAATHPCERNVAAGKHIRRLSGHVGEVHALAALPDGKTLVSGGEDGSVCLWNTKYRKIEYTTNSLPGNVRDFVFTPDSRQAATVNAEGQIEVWEAANLQPVPSLEVFGSSNACLSVVSRAGHSLLAAGTEGGWVQVLDISSLAVPQSVTNFKAHNGRVAALKFDPHGQTLMSSTLRPFTWEDSVP